MALSGIGETDAMSGPAFIMLLVAAHCTRRLRAATRLLADLLIMGIYSHIALITPHDHGDFEARAR